MNFHLFVLAVLLQRFCSSAKILQLPFERVRIGPYTNRIYNSIRRNASQERLTNFDNFAYVANATLGTPPQLFRMIMDTGSSTVWCPDKKAAVVGHGMFDSSKSSTYQKDGRDFHIKYGDGSYAEGFYGNDTFCFVKDLCATGQPFGQGVTISPKMYEGFIKFDGIVGMALKDLQKYKIQPPFQRLMDTLPEPIFSFWANTTKKISDPAGGEITFGGQDAKHCEPVNQWIKIQKLILGEYTWYQNTLESVKFGETVVGSGQAFISDTGTTVIVGPSAPISTLAKAVGARLTPKGYVIDCDAKPADIVFTIDGVQYSIPYTKYILYEHEENSQCLWGLQPFRYQFWILGDTFIRQYCSIYDPKNLRFAFAKNKFA